MSGFNGVHNTVCVYKQSSVIINSRANAAYLINVIIYQNSFIK